MEILIVDSSLQIIERLKEMLSEAENIHSIHKAVSYEEARKLFKQNKPDVVLLDIRLPGNKSLKLLKEIKTFRRNTCVIVLYTQINNYILELFQFLGADFLFDKYYDFEKISWAINTLGQIDEKLLPGIPQKFTQ
jgi:DNA-binding NarL/FixJ family response regulator